MPRRKGFRPSRERAVEDEFVFQNSLRLNTQFYASLGDKRAFVLSHARNLIILKIVGYAEAAVQYYRMPDTRAHVWIAHQRYPTKGRVWHPGGAHPFIGLNEALVHNGDFANYHSVCEYLAGRNIFPQFLTDTEVSVLLFDLWNRVYGYPVEYIIEALAPTTELDFDRLPAEKQRIYRQIQAAHIHASPDGPWFFIIARSLTESKSFQLLGITDTAMLRPQVFALQEGEVSIGLICSEKQAIDATLASLAAEDPRFTPVADIYWNARGGSYTDGGAFLLTVSPGGGNGNWRTYDLRVTNKFGVPVATLPGQTHCNLSVPPAKPAKTDRRRGGHRPGHRRRAIRRPCSSTFAAGWRRSSYDRPALAGRRDRRADGREAPGPGHRGLDAGHRPPLPHRQQETQLGADDPPRRAGADLRAAAALRRGERRHASADQLADPRPAARAAGRRDDAADRRPRLRARGRRLRRDPGRQGLSPRLAAHHPLQHPRHAVPRRGLRPADRRPADRLLRQSGRLPGLGHRRPGDLRPRQRPGPTLPDLQARQAGGLRRRGPDVPLRRQGRRDLRAGQRRRPADDQRRGHARGWSSTARRWTSWPSRSWPAIPRNGGGFAIVNGLRYDQHGKLVPLDLPYPGSNLLSLASGGAIYVRDPHRTLVDEQLNGGAYRPLGAADWKLMLPYLEENQRLFGIRIQQDLLTVDGVLRTPADVYRKVMPRKDAEIEAEMEGMGE